MSIEHIYNFQEGSQKTLNNLRMPYLKGISFRGSRKNDLGEGFEFSHIENNWLIDGDSLVITNIKGFQEITRQKWTDINFKELPLLPPEIGLIPVKINPNLNYIWINKPNEWVSAWKKRDEETGYIELYDYNTLKLIGHSQIVMDASWCSIRGSVGYNQWFEDCSYEFFEKYLGWYFYAWNTTSVSYVQSLVAQNNDYFMFTAHSNPYSIWSNTTSGGIHENLYASELVTTMNSRPAYKFSYLYGCTSLGEPTVANTWGYVLTKNGSSNSCAIGLNKTSILPPYWSHDFCKYATSNTIKNAFDSSNLENPIVDQMSFYGDITVSLTKSTAVWGKVDFSGFIDSSNKWSNESSLLDNDYYSTGYNASIEEVGYWSSPIELNLSTSSINFLEVYQGGISRYKVELYYNNTWNSFIDDKTYNVVNYTTRTNSPYGDIHLIYQRTYITGNAQYSTKVRLYIWCFSEGGNAGPQVFRFGSTTSIENNYNIRVATSTSNLEDINLCTISDEISVTSKSYSGFGNIGTQYYWKARKKTSGTWGNWSDTWNFTNGSLITAPVVTNSTGASNILSNSARLNGSITSTGGENPTVYIYYGNYDYGDRQDYWDLYTTKSNLGTKGVGSFYIDVSGLIQNFTYYYKCYAFNTAGATLVNTVSTFKTSYASATLSNSSGATGIKSNAATLNGYINTNGSQLNSVYIYYGLSNGGQSKTSWSNSIDFGYKSTTEFFSSEVTGLTPNTTYYYTCYSLNLISGLESWSPSSTSFITSNKEIQHYSELEKANIILKNKRKTPNKIKLFVMNILISKIKKSKNIEIFSSLLKVIGFKNRRSEVFSTYIKLLWKRNRDNNQKSLSSSIRTNVILNYLSNVYLFIVIINLLQKRGGSINIINFISNIVQSSISNYLIGENKIRSFITSIILRIPIDPIRKIAELFTSFVIKSHLDGSMIKTLRIIMQFAISNLVNKLNLNRTLFKSANLIVSRSRSVKLSTTLKSLFILPLRRFRNLGDQLFSVKNIINNPILDSLFRRQRILHINLKLMSLKNKYININRLNSNSISFLNNKYIFNLGEFNTSILLRGIITAFRGWGGYKKILNATIKIISNNNVAKLYELGKLGAKFIFRNKFFK